MLQHRVWSYGPLLYHPSYLIPETDPIWIGHPFLTQCISMYTLCTYIYMTWFVDKKYNTQELKQKYRLTLLHFFDYHIPQASTTQQQNRQTIKLYKMYEYFVYKF